MTQKPEYDQPNAEGFFGHFDLAHTVEELHTTYQRYRTVPIFIIKLEEKLVGYVGCPSPVYYGRRLI